ncbi:MAG: penicillin acylase family protein [Calditrichia bacterium]
MKKFTIIVFGILFLLTVAGIFSKKYMARSVGPYRGSHSLEGLKHQVTIMFDQKGIPQIFAEDNHDLFYAMGWLHATERLFQMELIRTLVQGKLSSLLDSKLKSLDVSMRNMQFYQRVRRDLDTTDTVILSLLEAYVNGVNSRINFSKPLPFEFILLDYRPEEWKVEDCLAIYMFQTWFSHSLMDHDTTYIKLKEVFGPEITSLFDRFFEWSPYTINPNESIISQSFPLSGMALASNSAVVAPSRSASGFALHESDPHLIINQIPNFWYLAGMHSNEGIDFIGVTLPGLPFGVMGRTQKVAFAFTVASVDIVDYYHYPFVDPGTDSVITMDGTKAVQRYTDLLYGKNKDQPDSLIIRTIDGLPVIKKDSTGYIAMKWAGFDFSPLKAAEAAYQLFYCNSFQEFRKIITSFGALDANWTYSDRDGNIGYQLGTPIPIRSVENSHILLDGTNPNHHWQGYYPLDKTPSAFNPEKGWIATCNNQIVPSDWPYPLPGFYDPYRIIRAAQLLSSSSVISLNTLRRFQTDAISGRALQWMSLFKQSGKHIDNAQIREQLSVWNGDMRPVSAIPQLFVRWWKLLPYFLFSDHTEMEPYAASSLLSAVLDGHPEYIIDRLDTEQQEHLADIAEMAFDSAYAEYQRAGRHPYSFLTLEHPFARIKLLDYFFSLNRGPYLTYGDGGTLNANWLEPRQDNKSFKTLVGASMRFLLDWSQPDSFSIYTNMGQSGNPFSPFYDSFIDNWLLAESWKVPMDSSLIKLKAYSTLTLMPRNTGNKSK